MLMRIALDDQRRMVQMNTESIKPTKLEANEFVVDSSHPVVGVLRSQFFGKLVRVILDERGLPTPPYCLIPSTKISATAFRQRLTQAEREDLDSFAQSKLSEEQKKTIRSFVKDLDVAAASGELLDVTGDQLTHGLNHLASCGILAKKRIAALTEPTQIQAMPLLNQPPSAWPKGLAIEAPGYTP